MEENVDSSQVSSQYWRKRDKEVEKKVERFLSYVLERAELVREDCFYRMERDIPSTKIQEHLSVMIDTSICTTIHSFVLAEFRDELEPNFLDMYADEAEALLEDEIPPLPILGLFILEKLEGRDIFRETLSDALYEVIRENQLARMLQQFVDPYGEQPYWFQEDHSRWS